jgi:hypothetical protein
MELRVAPSRTDWQSTDSRKLALICWTVLRRRLEEQEIAASQQGRKAGSTGRSTVGSRYNRHD